MIRFFETLVIAAAVVGLSISPCRADISSVSATGGATATLVYGPGLVCYTAYGCPSASYHASVVSDTITGGSSQLTFGYTPIPSGEDAGYNGERLILEVINGTGSTLGSFDFTIAGATFGAPGTLPEHGSYNATTTPPTYADGSFFGSLNGADTVWTGNLNLAPGAEKDFYLAAYYGSDDSGRGNFTLTQVVPEPGFYSVFGLGLSGLVVAVNRRKKAR